MEKVRLFLWKSAVSVLSLSLSISLSLCLTGYYSTVNNKSQPLMFELDFQFTHMEDIRVPSEMMQLQKAMRHIDTESNKIEN